MKTKSEHERGKLSHRRSERGNALIYVLIAVVLFAALSFSLGRQTDSNEASTLSHEQADLYATQLISYAAQAKSAVDQLLFTGSQIDDLEFMTSGESGFDTAPHIHKVFHPEGGGLNKGVIKENVKTQISTDPVSGWYMGRFNTTEWTTSSSDDVILVAYQISEAVCQAINEKITGSDAIPALSSQALDHTFIDASQHSASSNGDFTISECAACEGYMSLCVSNATVSAYAFYNIIAEQ